MSNRTTAAQHTHLLKHLGGILVSLRQRAQQPCILCLPHAEVLAAVLSAQRSSNQIRRTKLAKAGFSGH
jgi:hypothetical protein